MKLRLKFKNRKGAIATLAVIMMIPMVMCGSFAVDFANLMYLRTQLRTATDAGSLSGALQLLSPDKSTYLDSARTMTIRNQVSDTPIDASKITVTLGDWDEVEETFSTAGVTLANADAVRVVASVPGQKFLSNVFGLGPQEITVASVAWSGASVASTTCVKPWSMPYRTLLESIGEKVNFDRPLTDQDVQKLNTPPYTRFTLHNGGGSSQETGTPGNYYIVAYEPLEHIEPDGSITKGNPETGKNAYVKWAGTCVPYQVGPGDLLQTEPGVANGPTKEGFEEFCRSLGGFYKVTGGGGGECYEDQAMTQLGKHALVPLWSGSPQGRDEVRIKMVADFVLERVAKNSDISGYFVGTSVPTGVAGTVTTPIKKLMLVR